MGFSIIFPIFPEILNHYNSLGKDFILQVFIRVAHFISPSNDFAVITVLLGGISGSIYSFLQFIFAPLWGKISDSVGRKPILIFTSFGNLLGYVIWLLSGSFSTFVLSRLITGAMGGNISVASASMADSTTSAERAKGMGIIGAGIGLGFIFGPPIGGLLSKYNFPDIHLSLTVFPFSALFAISIALLNLIFVIFLFDETYQKGTQTKKKFHPFLEIAGLSNQKILSTSIIYFLFMFSFSGFEFVINFFLSKNYHFSPKEIGLTFVFIGLIIILIQGGVIRRISGKIAERKICIFGAIFICVGFAVLLIFRSLEFSFSGFALLAVGSALLNPGLSSLASLNSSPSEQGKNLGIMRSFGSLARALSPISFCLIYFLYDVYISFTVSLVITVVFLFILLNGKKLRTN